MITWFFTSFMDNDKMNQSMFCVSFVGATFVSIMSSLSLDWIGLVGAIDILRVKLVKAMPIQRVYTRLNRENVSFGNL